MNKSSVTRSQSVLADFAKNRIDDPFHKPTGMSGKLYPNGEFTLGYIPPKRKTEKEKRFDDAMAFQTVTVDVPRMVGKKVLYSLEETLHRDIILDSPLGLSTLTNSHNLEDFLSDPDYQGIYEWLEPRGSVSIPEVITVCLGRKVNKSDYFRVGEFLSLLGWKPRGDRYFRGVPKKKVTRKPRGSKGISGLGKRTIRNGAWILQKSYGKKQLGFLTVTLPSFRDRPDIMA